MKNLFTFLFALLYCVVINAQDGSSLTRGSVYQDDKTVSGQYVGTEQTLIYEETFEGDNTPTGLAARGWLFVDVDGGGTTTSLNGNPATFPAFQGTGFVAENYQGANGLYINQWLISPSISCTAGDTMSFWYRGTGSQWPDSVVVKFSPTGGSATADFTVDWGKSLVPATWTRRTFVVPTGGNVRFAVQYLMYDGGASGGSSDYWGMDLFQVNSGSIIPVELASFTANAKFDNVELKWTTATEKNNKGFQIERKILGGDYQVLGFVNGNGTTTEQKSYSYVDSKIASGKYIYRLKQVDFDGTSTYSPTVEVEIVNPTEFTLEQNYPNPFNPSTSIKFALPFESAISLTVYNAIGQVVDVIASGKYTAGVHTLNYDASKLNSGVYLYKLNANSIDGKTFSFTKKMILTK